MERFCIYILVGGELESGTRLLEGRPDVTTELM